MTIRDFMQWLEQFQHPIGVALVAFPFLTYGLAALLRVCSRSLARYFLAGAVFVTVLPGISMVVLLGYMFLFLQANLLQEVQVILHLLPILSMLATFWAVSRLTDLDQLPGVLHLQGLMLLVGLSFAGLLFIHKTFISIHFFASFEHLLALLAGFIILWQYGIGRLFGKTKK